MQVVITVICGLTPTAVGKYACVTNKQIRKPMNLAIRIDHRIVASLPILFPD